MRKIGCTPLLLSALAFMALSIPAFAGDVPPITAADFGGASPEANAFWLFLAGQGIMGTIIIGLVNFIYKLARPYIIAWVEERKLARLYLSLEAFVAKNNAEYVAGMKAANADGKLTKDEAEKVFLLCKRQIIDFMLSQGVDIIREYGDEFVGGLIELLVSRMKNPLAKAVAVPLSGSSASAPLPPSVTGGALPA